MEFAGFHVKKLILNRIMAKWGPILAPKGFFKNKKSDLSYYMASAKRHYIPGDIWHAPVKYVKGNISSKTTWFEFRNEKFFVKPRKLGTHPERLGLKGEV